LPTSLPSFEEQPWHIQSRAALPRHGGTSADGWETSRLLCKRLALAPSRAQLAAPKGGTRLSANRPALTFQSALPSNQNAAQPARGKLLKTALPLKADLTLSLPPSLRLSTRLCFLYPLPNDCVSGTAVPSLGTVGGAPLP